MLMVMDQSLQNQQRCAILFTFLFLTEHPKEIWAEENEQNRHLFCQADGLDAVARVGVAADHRGIVCDHHVFRIVQHWLHAGEPDPFYDPLNDYVILPTIFEVEKHHEKRGDVTSVREDWEIISHTDNDHETKRLAELPAMVSTLSASREGKEGSLDEAQATVVVHPESGGRQHVEVRAVGVSHG
jgi:hypothetical protein